MKILSSIPNEARGSPPPETVVVSSSFNLNGDAHNVRQLIHPSELKREEEYILLTLASGRQLYGLQISTKIKEKSNQQKQLSTARLYSHLSSLEKKGLVRSRWENSNDPSRRGARRKYYSITDDGSNLIDQADAFRKELRTRD